MLGPAEGKGKEQEGHKALAGKAGAGKAGAGHVPSVPAASSPWILEQRALPAQPGDFKAAKIQELLHSQNCLGTLLKPALNAGIKSGIKSTKGKG